MGMTFTKDEIGYKKLEAVAILLTLESKNGCKYHVEDCYEDYGADMMWTTIIRDDDDCQVLNPKEWDDIFFAETPAELVKCVEDIRNGKFFRD